MVFFAPGAELRALLGEVLISASEQVFQVFRAELSHKRLDSGADVPTEHLARDLLAQELVGERDQRGVVAADDEVAGAPVDRVDLHVRLDLAGGCAIARGQVRNVRLRQMHDGRRAAVGDGERKRRRLELAGDGVETLGIGATEAVDRLIFVSASDESACTHRDHAVNHRALHGADVLRLVDEHPFVPGEREPKSDAQVELVVEVDRAVVRVEGQAEAQDFARQIDRGAHDAVEALADDRRQVDVEAVDQLVPDLGRVLDEPDGADGVVGHESDVFGLADELRHRRAEVAQTRVVARVLVEELVGLLCVGLGVDALTEVREHRAVADAVHRRRADVRREPALDLVDDALVESDVDAALRRGDATSRLLQRRRLARASDGLEDRSLVLGRGVFDPREEGGVLRRDLERAGGDDGLDGLGVVDDVDVVRRVHGVDGVGFGEASEAVRGVLLVGHGAFLFRP